MADRIEGAKWGGRRAEPSRGICKTNSKSSSSTSYFRAPLEASRWRTLVVRRPSPPVAVGERAEGLDDVAVVLEIATDDVGEDVRASPRGASADAVMLQPVDGNGGDANLKRPEIR